MSNQNKPRKYFFYWMIILVIFLILIYYITIKITANPIFIINNISVKGIEYSDRREIAETTNTFLGLNLFSIDNIDTMESLKALTDNNPWVLGIKVKKRYPSSLLVEVYEDIPVFKIKNSSGTCAYYTINDNFIKTNCAGYKVVVTEALDLGNLRKFNTLYPKLSKYNSTIMELHNGYFRMFYDNINYNASYNIDEVVDILNILERKDIYGLYTDISYINLQGKNKIYVKGEK